MARGAELVGSILFGFILPMLRSLLESWNSFGLEITKNLEFDAPGNAKGTKRLPMERKARILAKR